MIDIYHCALHEVVSFYNALSRRRPIGEFLSSCAKPACSHIIMV